MTQKSEEQPSSAAAEESASTAGTSLSDRPNEFFKAPTFDLRKNILVKNAIKASERDSNSNLSSATNVPPTFTFCKQLNADDLELAVPIPFPKPSAVQKRVKGLRGIGKTFSSPAIDESEDESATESLILSSDEYSSSDEDETQFKTAAAGKAKKGGKLRHRVSHPPANDQAAHMLEFFGGDSESESNECHLTTDVFSDGSKKKRWSMSSLVGDYLSDYWKSFWSGAWKQKSGKQDVDSLGKEELNPASENCVEDTQSSPVPRQPTTSTPLSSSSGKTGVISSAEKPVSPCDFNSPNSSTSSANSTQEAVMNAIAVLDKSDENWNCQEPSASTSEWGSENPTPDHEFKLAVEVIALDGKQDPPAIILGHGKPPPGPTAHNSYKVGIETSKTPENPILMPKTPPRPLSSKVVHVPTPYPKKGSTASSPRVCSVATKLFPSSPVALELYKLEQDASEFETPKTPQRFLHRVCVGGSEKRISLETTTRAKDGQDEEGSAYAESQENAAKQCEAKVEDGIKPVESEDYHDWDNKFCHEIHLEETEEYLTGASQESTAMASTVEADAVVTDQVFLVLPPQSAREDATIATVEDATDKTSDCDEPLCSRFFPSLDSPKAGKSSDVFFSRKTTRNAMRRSLGLPPTTKCFRSLASPDRLSDRPNKDIRVSESNSSDEHTPVMFPMMSSFNAEQTKSPPRFSVIELSEDITSPVIPVMHKRSIEKNDVVPSASTDHLHAQLSFGNRRNSTDSAEEMGAVGDSTGTLVDAERNESAGDQAMNSKGIKTDPDDAVCNDDNDEAQNDDVTEAGAEVIAIRKQRALLLDLESDETSENNAADRETIGSLRSWASIGMLHKVEQFTMEDPSTESASETDQQQQGQEGIAGAELNKENNRPALRERNETETANETQNLKCTTSDYSEDGEYTSDHISGDLELKETSLSAAGCVYTQEQPLLKAMLRSSFDDDDETMNTPVTHRSEQHVTESPVILDTQLGTKSVWRAREHCESVDSPTVSSLDSFHLVLEQEGTGAESEIDSASAKARKKRKQDSGVHMVVKEEGSKNVSSDEMNADDIWAPLKLLLESNEFDDTTAAGREIPSDESLKNQLPECKGLNTASDSEKTVSAEEALIVDQGEALDSEEDSDDTADDREEEGSTNEESDSARDSECLSGNDTSQVVCEERHESGHSVSDNSTEEVPGSVDSKEEVPGSDNFTDEDPGSVDSTDEDPGSVDSADEDPGSVDSTDEDPGSVDSADEDAGSVDSTDEDPGSDNFTDEDPGSVDSTDEELESGDDSVFIRNDKSGFEVEEESSSAQQTSYQDSSGVNSADKFSESRGSARSNLLESWSNEGITGDSSARKSSEMPDEDTTKTSTSDPGDPDEDSEKRTEESSEQQTASESSISEASENEAQLRIRAATSKMTDESSGAEWSGTKGPINSIKAAVDSRSDLAEQRRSLHRRVKISQSPSKSEKTFVVHVISSASDVENAALTNRSTARSSTDNDAPRNDEDLRDSTVKRHRTRLPGSDRGYEADVSDSDDDNDEDIQSPIFEFVHPDAHEPSSV